MTPEQYKTNLKIEEEVKMQPRRIRAKNIVYLGLFSLWYASVVLFIMYRLRSDDLDQLEKEAEERIKIGQFGNAKKRSTFE